MAGPATLRVSILLFVWLFVRPAEAAAAKRVVMLFGLPLSWPSVQAILHESQAAFNAKMPGQVEVWPEYVKDPDSDVQWLLAKYKNQPIDLIATVGSPPAPVGVEFHHRLGPAPPLIVALNTSDTTPVAIDGPNIVLLEAEMRVMESVNTALRLFPYTKYVAYVGGGRPVDVSLNGTWIHDIQKRWPQLRLIDLTKMPLAEIERRVENLPAETICFLGSAEGDSQGLVLSKPILAAALAPHVSAPMFDFLDLSFGTGVTGGWVASMALIGDEIADIGVRLFRGESAGSLGTVHAVPGLYRFDHRQLRRWHADLKRLPKGSSIEFIEPTVWERYRPWLTTALGSAVTLVALLLYLLIEGRRRERSHFEYKERVGFDAILGQAMLSLRTRTSLREDESIQEMLHRLREHLRVDVIVLLVTRSVDEQLILRGFYSPAETNTLGPQDYPYIMQELRAGRDIRLTNLAELPSEAKTDTTNLESKGVRSLFGAPLLKDGQAIGAIIAGDRMQREWPDELIQRVRDIGAAAVDVWGQDLAAAETLSQSILGSFEGYLVALDRNGRILHANSPALVQETGTGLRQPLPHGTYLDIWRGLPEAPAAVMEGVRQVLSGEKHEVEEEVRYERGDGERWLYVRIEPLEHASGGALVTHLDTTERKRAELAGAHDMKMIAHWNRVSALGELASSLAHEVNQPLSAILTNTEVAKSMLEAPHPDLAELKDVLADVQGDGRRAAAVIREMRGLLRKNPSSERELIDVSEVTRETLRLITNDAAGRKVRIDMEIGSDEKWAAVGRTQLQQVILNLLSNALDAAESAAEGERWAAIRTAADDEWITIEVEDSGPGVSKAKREQVFEPFLTTKGSGLGMGLTISRSIVHAAGGKISVETGRSGGALLRVRLPRQTTPALPALESSFAEKVH